MSTQHTISVLVSNTPGVLARVSGLFSRRGFNIESLAVSVTHDPEISRITLVTSVQEERILEQLVKQLNKLIDVHKVIELEDNATRRELLLVKVHSDVNNRSDIIDVVGLFRGKAVDVSPESITIEVTGSQDKLSALLTMLEPHGIIELVKSGQVALTRGGSNIHEKKRPALKAAD